MLEKEHKDGEAAETPAIGPMRRRDRRKVETRERIFRGRAVPAVRTRFRCRDD